MWLLTPRPMGCGISRLPVVPLDLFEKISALRHGTWEWNVKAVKDLGDCRPVPSIHMLATKPHGSGKQAADQYMWHTHR